MSKMEDGFSQREHLERLAERGHASAIEQLDGPDLPYALSYLWVWFIQLSAGRASTGMGMAGISYQDIWFWGQLMDVRPAPHEVRAIMSMDVTYRNALSKETK